jgi:hypothetical protein
VFGQPPQRRLQQRRSLLEPGVVLALVQQSWEQVTDPARRGPQPAPLVVVAQQHLSHGQAHQLSVGDHHGAARPPPPAWLVCRDDPVVQLHVQCDEKSVQIGVHAASCKSTYGLSNADHGHSSS